LSGRLFKDWILKQSTWRDKSSDSTDEWSAIKRAVEQALPFYEGISEAISLGLAGPLRRRAMRRLEPSRKEWILDSGTGPGVSSALMLQDGFEKIIGLDPSLSLLRSTKARLTDSFYPVQAVAENVPLRAGSVAGVITCFSLRDVRDKAQSVAEFARVAKDNGLLEIVDVGKPDNRFFQGLIRTYISLIMPILARLLIGRRERVNPFRMIIPTFRRLPTNRALTSLCAARFGSPKIHQFLIGGLVIVEAERTKSS
jgi:demethylmenaquinone methyltransferase / 2-methoxy-6-polyprenyl-1,4-benzoquinol methylase